MCCFNEEHLCGYWLKHPREDCSDENGPGILLICVGEDYFACTDQHGCVRAKTHRVFKSYRRYRGTGIAPMYWAQECIHKVNGCGKHDGDAVSESPYCVPLFQRALRVQTLVQRIDVSCSLRSTKTNPASGLCACSSKVMSVLMMLLSH